MALDPMPQDSSLTHYGVMGMKWGVRKDQRKLGSASRIKAKREHIEGKLAKSKGDSNFAVRNTVNDYRRGRVAALRTKEAHRAAKEAYIQNKTAENKQALNKARTDRLVKNVGAKAVGISANDRGAYNRYRQSGDDYVTAALKTGGRVLAKDLAVTSAVNVGMTAAGMKAMSSAMNTPYRSSGSLW